MNAKQSGFTLVEIAIVLVIIGLLLGGVLKGQEMITNAKVRNLADQGTSIKAAYFAFQDRFRALPGDFLNATTNIAGAAANGNGDGIVGSGGGGAAAAERGSFWQHLAAAGFVTGNFDGQAQGNNLTCPSSRCMANTYGSPMMFAWGSHAAGSGSNAHELRTGRRLPVGVIAELDRKVDDGLPHAGSFQTDDQANDATCANAAGNSNYELTVANPQTDCGGVYIL